jgi:hypothetical protein
VPKISKILLELLRGRNTLCFVHCTETLRLYRNICTETTRLYRNTLCVPKHVPKHIMCTETCTETLLYVPKHFCMYRNIYVSCTGRNTLRKFVYKQQQQLIHCRNFTQKTAAEFFSIFTHFHHQIIIIHH